MKRESVLHTPHFIHGARESGGQVKARRGSSAPVLLDEIAALLGDHDGRGVGVARDDGRQHREVYHAQARHATHPARTTPRHATHTHTNTQIHTLAYLHHTPRL